MSTLMEAAAAEVAGGAAPVLALDVGGTKLAMGIVAPDGRLTERVEEPTESGREAVIAQIVRAAERLRGRCGMTRPVAIGIGFPAVLAHETDRVVWAPKLPGFADVELRQHLADLLGVPVFMEYDGHAAALGEWWMGAGQGHSTVVTVIVGTGLGGGVIVDGRLHRGANRLAGMVGWFALSWQLARDDPARAIGEWDHLASGPGIAQRARARLSEGRRSSLSAETVTAQRVLAAARDGDALALELVQETARMIGAGVSNIVSMLDPEVVVLGGSVGMQPELLETVRAVVRATTHPIAARRVRIASSQLGADAVLFGAAYSAWQRVGRPVTQVAVGGIRT